MTGIIGTMLRALVIVVAWGAIGAGFNCISANPIPWIYSPAKFINLEGMRVPLIDEKKAMELFQSQNTVFVDSRKQEDYGKSHVKGSIFISPNDMEERFVSVEPLLPQHFNIVLYCYGPECDMAEQVAVFLAQMQYKNLFIMTSGFPAWEKAGYPVDRAGDHRENTELFDHDQETQVARIFKSSSLALLISSLNNHEVIL
jgi:rhodanese-related sulfurtransferase